MRVTGLGKIVILLLILGAAVGGWRAFQSLNGKGGLQSPLGGSKNSGGNSGTNNRNGSSNNGFNNGNNGSDNGGGNGSGDTSSTGTDAGTGGDVAANGNEILLLTSATKRGWLIDQIGKFNTQNNGKYRITTKFLETRDAMHAILEGKVKPALWSPSSTIWTARLAQAWQQKNGKPILNLDDADSYRVFFRSPLVFLTTKQKLPLLKPILTGGWDKLRQASGKVKFAHADPLTANSGMMTLGLILADYAQQTGGDPTDIAGSEKFRTYMQSLERGLVFDLPAQGGSSALFKAFVANPNRYDFITTYESNAIDEAIKNPQIAVIYPNPTAVSESVGAVLQGDWLSSTQQEGARAFLQFLGTQQAMREGLAYHFRPAQSGGTLSISNTLNQLRGQGFQQSFSAVELPPYEALNAAAFQWRTHVAHMPPQ